MMDREQVVKGLKCCMQHGALARKDCNGHIERYTESGKAEELVGYHRDECPYKDTKACATILLLDALWYLEGDAQDDD